MRFLLAFALCCWPALAQSDQESESNMSCVERLQMPLYPPLAALARISGRITTTINLTASGMIESTKMEAESAIPNAKLLLGAAVEQALHESAFHRGCGEKSVRLIFHFGFDSDPYKRVSFGYPNQFWISVLPPTPIFN